jgi:hypothetical protein
MVNGTIAIGRPAIMDRSLFRTGVVACSRRDILGLSFLDCLKCLDGDITGVTDDVARSLAAPNCA